MGTAGGRSRPTWLGGRRRLVVRLFGLFFPINYFSDPYIIVSVSLLSFKTAAISLFLPYSIVFKSVRVNADVALGLPILIEYSKKIIYKLSPFIQNLLDKYR